MRKDGHMVKLCGIVGLVFTTTDIITIIVCSTDNCIKVDIMPLIGQQMTS